MVINSENEISNSNISLIDNQVNLMGMNLSVDDLPIGIYKTTLFGELLFANRAFVEMTGFDSLEELKNINVMELYLIPEIRKIQSIQFSDLNIMIDEYELLRKNGTTIWVRDRCKRIVDENGFIVFEGTIEDISQQQLALENLTDSEFRFRSLVETMDQGLAFHQIILDDNGKPIDYVFIDVNPSFEKLTGLNKEAIIGKRVLEIMPDTEYYWIETYGKVALTGKTETIVNYSIELNKYFEVTAYCPQKFSFAVVINDITETKLTEIALAESELKLRTLINAVPDFICFKDGEGKWIEGNDFLMDLFTLDRYEDLGKNDAELAKDRPLLANTFFNCKASDEIAWQQRSAYRSDEEIEMPDGSKKIFDVIKVPIFHSDGNRNGIVVIGRDNTEKTMLESVLSETNNLYKTLVETLPDSITVANLQGRLSYMSPQAIALFRIEDEASVLGKNVFHFVDPKDSKKAKELIRKLVNNQNTNTSELSFIRNDGSKFLGEVRSAILIDSNGKTFGTISIIRDITKRKENDELLKHSENTFRIISELLSDYVYSVKLYKDGSIKLDWLIGGFDKITGYTIEELDIDNGGYSKIINQEDYEYFIANHQKDLIQLIEVEAEYRITCKNGEEKWICDKIKPYRKEGEPDVLYQIGAVSDITERKKQELALLKGSDSLKIINEQKDRFFSVLAHDLKSPLSAFLGLTKIFATQLEELSVSDIQEYAIILHKSANNIFTLLENLLEWASMQRGAKDFSPQHLSLSFIFHNNIDLLSGSFNQKNVELVAKLDDSINIFADVQMLNSLLRNLLTNALKFSHRGSKVTIYGEEIDDSIRISIEDQGIGMDEASTAKLFQIGEKVSNIGTEGEPSTGLGLLLCKEFVSAHAGKIWVESQLGVGTKFSFTFPIK